MSTPPKVDVATRTEHSVFISLDHSDERLKPDYRVGEFRPSSLTLRWIWSPPANVWDLEVATVSGPMVKKDGTDSQNRAKTSFGWLTGRKLEDGPQWVRDLIDAHTPTTIGTGR